MQDTYDVMSNTFGDVAVDGGYLNIYLRNKLITQVYVPQPFWADKARDSVNENEDYFADDNGNTYRIYVWSSMGGISYEIDIDDIQDEDEFNYFRKNAKIDYEPIIPEDYTFKQIESAYEKRQRWSKELIENNLYEISIVINVSSIETLLKDLFISNEEYWFDNIDNNKINEHIIQIVKTYNLSKQYLKFLWNELEANNQNLKINLLFNLLLNNSKNNNYIELNEVLNNLNDIEFDKNQKIKILHNTIKNNIQNINFQKKEGTGSFNWLFKKVFNIDILKFLEKEKINNTSIKIYFNEMYQLRHKLIHGVGNDDIEKEQAELYYNVTKKLNDFLVENINNFHNYTSIIIEDLEL